MTRIEENTMLLERIKKEADRKPTGTFEVVVTFQLGSIASTMADISRSLAILADKGKSEEENGGI